MLRKLVLALRAGMVGAVGLLIARAQFNGESLLAPLGLVLGAMAIGLAADGIARFQVVRRPRAALWLMEPWILFPLGLASLAAWLATLAVAALQAPTGASPETEALMKGGAAIITAFLGTAFIAWLGEEDASIAAKRTRDRFQAAFKSDPRIQRLSRAERLLYSDPVEGIAGWTFASRHRRVNGLDSELTAARGEAPPRSASSEAPPPPAASRDAPPSNSS